MQLLTFDRKFDLFSYTVSHGLLLFRSGKNDIQKTRVDVLFQDVRAIECRAFCDGLTVTEVGLDYLKGSRSSLESILGVGLKVYALTGNNWSGYIIGGVVQWCEDDDQYFHPSKLIC